MCIIYLLNEGGGGGAVGVMLYPFVGSLLKLGLHCQWSIHSGGLARQRRLQYRGRWGSILGGDLSCSFFARWKGPRARANVGLI